MSWRDPKFRQASYSSGIHDIPQMHGNPLPHGLIANSFIVGCLLAFVRWRLVTAVHLNIGVMRDATFFPVISHFLSDKGIWIFASKVATRADFAPSRQYFFHFHLRILSSDTLACRIKKAQRGLFPAGNCFVRNTWIKGMRHPLASINGLPKEAVTIYNARQACLIIHENATIK